MVEPDRIPAGGPAADEQPDGRRVPSKRPYISVRFDCCNVFARIYLNPAGNAFVGWCPRCARKVMAKVSPDGTTARIFRVG